MRSGGVRLAGLMLWLLAGPGFAQDTVYHATLREPGQKTAEASTEDVRRALADGSALVLDSRKRAEYVAGHIAGARNAAPSAGAPPAEFVAMVERLAGGDKSRALILYCNGQHCQASRRLSEQLVGAGFGNVRRYQLGIPMWRTLGGAVEIELEGVLRVYKVDGTAVFLDARNAEAFARGTLPGAHNVPVDALGARGLEHAPLPNEDFNTRVVLFGDDGTQARRLADLIGKTPYQNVSYFPGTFAELLAAARSKHGGM